MLRLHFEGNLIQREVATSCGCSHSTLKRVLREAQGLGITFDTVKDMADTQIGALLYPKAKLKGVQSERDL